MTNWRHLASGMTGEFRRICLQCERLELVLNDCFYMRRLDLLPTDNMLRETGRWEEVWRTLFFLTKKICKNKEEVKMIESRFYDIRKSILSPMYDMYKYKTDPATIRANLDLYLTAVHQFIVTFVYPALERIKRHCMIKAEKDIGPIMSYSIGATRLPKEYEEEGKSEEEVA